MYCAKALLKNFAKLAGKYLRQSLFSNEVAGLRPATLLKKRLWYICFPVNFVELFFVEHFQWLLLEETVFYGCCITISEHPEPEAAFRMRSTKHLFKKASQSSQENICSGVLFILKLQTKGRKLSI